MTYSSEKFCLKWNDFQENLVSSYHDLRKEADFSDVTLVCEEDQQVEAHRIILSACSPFFSRVLKRNKQPNPIIYMRGLKAKDLVAIVDFIYHGEANIYQEDLDGFLALAEELQLKGLEGSQDNILDAVEEPMSNQRQQQPKRNKVYKENNYYPTVANEGLESSVIIKPKNHAVVPVDGGKMIVALDTNIEDSMMEIVDDGEHKWRCTLCGKTTKGQTAIARRDMRRHIETHMEGLSYPCNQCDKVSRSSNGFRQHVSNSHQNKTNK